MLLDLTHTLDTDIPSWPGKPCLERRFNTQSGITTEIIRCSSGIGTHMDAPRHFYQDGRGIDDFNLEELIGDLYVIDIKDKAAKNHDYCLTVADINEFESQHQTITPNSIVLLNSGWSSRWQDINQYRNTDSKGQMHFPGFSAQAATLLIERKIKGVGIDTLSLDCGTSADFIAHQIFLQANCFQLENVNIPENLPSVGATIYAMPIKLKNAPEAPVRVFASC